MVDTNHRIGSSMLINQIKQNCIITVLSSLPRLEKNFSKVRVQKIQYEVQNYFYQKIFCKKH